MNRLIPGTLCFVLMSAAAAEAGPGKKGTSRTAVARESHDDRGGTSVRFSVEHVRIIRGHYAPRYRNLPPGLQKKYARTGQLPPGWQKKMEPMPVALERTLPRLPDGYRRGVIDGHAVIYSSRTGTVIDVAVLF